MKRILFLLVLPLAIGQQPSAFSQGTLTPPGPPGPTMKSLDQIEARKPISTAPFSITQPGSYYLTTNLSVSSGTAITIAANGVTLDLNGFIISSTEATPTGTAILINSLRNITIANGFIQGGVTNNGSGIYSGSGFANGVTYGTSLANVLVSRVSVSGCLNNGIFLGSSDSIVVESCTVRTVGGFGIDASTVKQSSAIDCGGSAIEGNQVSDCRGESSGSGDGVNAGVALNCNGQSSSGVGVFAYTALNCFGESGGGDGVHADTALNCYGQSSNGGGVYSPFLATNCVGFSNGGIGILAPATANDCYGNSSSSDGINAGIAIGCYGASSSGVGLRASLANSSYGTSEVITNKYNMP